MTSTFNATSDVEGLLAQMTLDEKVRLLSGKASSTANDLERLGIPSLITADGPHGIRSVRSFDSNPSCLLPCATSMGATFDVELLERVGRLLGDEARNKGVHVLLAPTVCLQRSPLMGRGFEAFGEDPILSGTLGASYIRGVQNRGVGTCVKHFAAHDQSKDSIEDNVCMTQRTLRELHLLPFQLTVHKANPWSLMTAYHKINGTHASEDPLLLTKILREEWGFKGLVMSDWWGTYSVAEAINAGLDSEMPGPTVFRGRCLSWAVQSRKVSETTIDASVRNLLNLLKKVIPAKSTPSNSRSAADTSENRGLIRRVAADGVVLLKNERNMLPLKPEEQKTLALIGGHFKTPSLGGGGSSEVEPYYTSTPYDAIVEIIGKKRVTYATGAYSFKFSPYLKNLTVPDSADRGWLVEIFGENPANCSSAVPVYKTTTTKDMIDVPESLNDVLPRTFFVRARTVHTPETSCSFRFGLAVAGKGKLFINGKESIDLWTDQPPKTDETPVFNRVSMERFADINVTAGKPVHLQLLLTNSRLSRAIGTAATLTARIGGFQVIDEDQAILDAVEIAKKVDVPIVMTGLSMDYEYESSDRKTLKLPSRLDDLIAATLMANPNTIIVTQAGMPIEMPWVDKAHTLLHAWYGGQETGHGLSDILFGFVNPSARLPVTFPRSLRDTASYLTFGKADRDIVYGEGVFIGYRYYEKLEREPLFYFGHGLSYSKFEYSNLAMPETFEASAHSNLQLSVEVTNVGPYDGCEVVQLYIQDIVCSVQRPIKELKAFKKIQLAVGETASVEIALDKYALSFWSEEDSKWKAEKGEFTAILCRSADPKDEVLRKSFALKDTFYWSGL